MKMNTQRGDQVFGVVEKPRVNNNYTGVETDTAKVSVNNVTREISVDVNFSSMLGETPTTAYPGHHGAQTRYLLLKTMSEIEDIQHNLEAEDNRLSQALDDAVESLELTDNKLSLKIDEETNRALNAEKQLVVDIEQVAQSSTKQCDKVREDMLVLSNDLIQTSEQLRSDLDTTTKSLQDSDTKIYNDINQIRNTYAEKSYVQEKIIEFTQFSKQVVDDVDLESNKVIKDNISTDPVDGVLYLVKTTSSSGVISYNEYTVIEGILTLIGDTGVDLDGYATIEFVDNTAEELKEFVTRSINDIPEVNLEEYAKTEQLPTKLSELENDADYAKVSDIPDVSSFIAEIPEEYVTEKELAEKGYCNITDVSDVLLNIKFIDGGTASSLTI